MDPEMLELAQSAVAALQAATQPTWTDITTALAAVVVGVTQCGLIAWGIRVMRDSNQSRDATLIALKDQSQALADVGAALRDQGQALRDQSQALADIGAGIQELLRERRTP